ncbi:MAG: hypothetical protein E6Q88_02695 [Lysobacteraceae bacterium]|nr:MAG: hypothetical protein E6Q88_02695 [Xanthomonadaceae bacterium]
MDRLREKPSDWPVVLTIHGIRTTGDWQRELTDVLTRHGFRHVPLGFGFFRAVSLLMPWSRARKVEWFRKIYSDKFAVAECLPSVIAHSFGSYIVTKAMLKYSDIRFDRMILCGAIVSRAYPWSTVLIQRNQARTVLNEAGGRDSWARLVEWVVSDAGSSGVSGFEDLADGRVMQLIHERHEHSDYFYRQNFEQRWIPFLRGGEATQTVPVGEDAFNWKFVTTLLLLVSSLILCAWFLIGRGHSAGSFYQEQASTVRRDAGPVHEQSVVAPKPGSEKGTDIDGDGIPDPSGYESMFRYLRGAWVHNGDLPESSRPVIAGRCYKRKNALTTLIFDRADQSLDEGSGTVSGSWHQSSRNAFQYKPEFPVDFGKAVDGRKACTMSEREVETVVFYEEKGRIRALAEDWDASGDGAEAKIHLRVEECSANGIDCDSDMFGERALPNIEYISDVRLRIGDMIFVRQAPER